MVSRTAVFLVAIANVVAVTVSVSQVAALSLIICFVFLPLPVCIMMQRVVLRYTGDRILAVPP